MMSVIKTYSFNFYKSYYIVGLIGGKLLLTRRRRLSNRNCQSGKQ